ncbi:MAG TPA: hypothetical protein VE197_00155, partial [Mycobacterium sp.]|nr:hypothetical protein [Mycobacterium sp.]
GGPLPLVSPQVADEDPPAAMAFPQTVAGTFSAAVSAVALLVEPVALPVAVPQVPADDPPRTVAPFPHTVTGTLTAAVPAEAELPPVSGGVPHWLEVLPPSAVTLLPHTVTGASTATVEAPLLELDGGRVTLDAGVPAVLPHPAGSGWPPTAMSFPHTVTGACTEMDGGDGVAADAAADVRRRVMMLAAAPPRTNKRNLKILDI